MTFARIVAVRHGWLEWISLYLAALGTAALLAFGGLAAPLDNLIHDTIVRATPRAPDPRILIVAIDDASLRTIGHWPWPRTVHAQMLDRLGEHFPLAIGYDVLFVDPAPGDDALNAAAARHDTLVLPLLYAAPGDNGADHKIVQPVAKAMTGHVNVTPDVDGVFRRVQLWTSHGDAEHLAAAVAGVAGGPFPARGSLIPYTGPPGHYPTISFDAVLRGEVPPELMRERIVMVGATAPGLGDRFATPVAGGKDLMAGVEVQANIVDALLHGGLRTDMGAGAATAFAGLWLALLWSGFLLLGPRANLIAAATVVVAMLGSSALLLGAGFWIGPAAGLIALALAFPLWGWRRLAFASRFLATELDRLGGATGELPPPGDPLSRQIALVDAAGARLEMLRRQRDETLAFLSHDLRGPAAAIVGLEPSDARIAGHARRLLRLADQFVQGLRAEDAPLVFEPVELAALLDEAADQCWEAAERVSGRVEVGCSWDLPELSTDRALMARAVVNLIDNALKYGGEAPRVRVRGWVQRGEAVVTVADDGPSLEPEQAAGLFTPYERAGASRPDGVGLGLALVATFARRHEGSVRCIARPGLGALFELRLPLI